jgi:hypothetical protein
MKYENVLSKKFIKYLETITQEKKIVDKEEKFFNKLKKAFENIKKE